MPSIKDIKDIPAMLSDLLPKTRTSGDRKEYSNAFKLTFPYSPNILAMLSLDGETVAMDHLWDDDGKPDSSIKHIEFKREFENHTLHLTRNGKNLVSFPAERLYSWRVKPSAGGMLEVSFRAFGIFQETTKLHKLDKDQSILLSVEEGFPGSQKALVS